MILDKNINDAINHLDALDTYHSLEKGQQQMTYYKETDELIEKLKLSLHNIRNNWLQEHSKEE